MYVFHDLQGNIQGTISGPGRDYGEVLDREGRLWIYYEGAITLDVHSAHVDMETKQLVANKPMFINVSKDQFFANGVDEAVVTGIPIGSNITILCDDKPWSQHYANEESLEFASDQIATYKLIIGCPKYIPTTLTLKAIEPVTLGDGYAMDVPDYTNIGK